MRASSAILLACAFIAGNSFGQGFRFSNPDPADQAASASKANTRAAVDAQLSTPCRQRIKDRKIMVLLGEEKNGFVMAPQAGFGRHVEAINTRLQSLGLRTYTPEQVRKQIAQEEVDAYFKNDPDRALSASKRLAAQYVLKGVVSTTARPSGAPGLNVVDVALRFTLADSAGRPLSVVEARNKSYSGADVNGMALTLIEERSEEVVARLYSDYCQQAK